MSEFDLSDTVDQKPKTFLGANTIIIVILISIVVLGAILYFLTRATNSKIEYQNEVMITEYATNLVTRGVVTDLIIENNGNVTTYKYTADVGYKCNIVTTSDSDVQSGTFSCKKIAK